MTDARENYLRNLLQQIASEQKYDNPVIETLAVPTTGANFSSQLFYATIKATNKEDLNVFAKVAVVGENIREQTGDIFGIESYFYTNVARTYKEIEDKHNVPKEHRLFVSKFYGYSNTYLQEVLVLEDLSKDGYVTHDRLKSIDWDYASKAVEEMAKLHALSIAFQEEYPKEYQDSIKVFNTSLFEEDGALAKMLDGSTDRTLQMTREENRPKMQKFLEEYIINKRFMKFFTPKKRPVIMHSDYRPSNLMHKVDQDKKLRIAIMDYQTLNPGSVTIDLLYFIFTGSDGAFRAQYYDQLIELYYENLSINLKRLHFDVEEAFPRNYFDKELEEMLPFGLIIAGVLMPLITIDIADVASTESGEIDSEALTAMTQNSGLTNPLCIQRFNEVVDDFVKWGVL